MPSIQEDEIARQVIDVIASLCNRPPDTLELQASLFDDLGVDSIRFMELLAMLEEEFAFELDVEDLRPELFRTIRSVVHFAVRKAGRT